VDTKPLEELSPDTLLVVGGDQVLRVPPDVAARFRPGDALVFVAAEQQLLLIPARERQIAGAAVTRAAHAFRELLSVSDAQVDDFYARFAGGLESEQVWQQIALANQQDVADAKARGRSTTRLVASDKLRRGMIEGLRGWARMGSLRGRAVERVDHGSWSAELVVAPLGIVGFVFEGRPNVLADATGVLKSGNSVVFRIGRDALGTARAIMEHALVPALRGAGLPEGAVCLIESAEHAAGWALFADQRLSLAVARGSGPTVAMLGALARQAGTPVSLHGTGGAWLMASSSSDAADFEAAVYDSLDRKVCNTLNVCCVPRSEQARLLPGFLRALERAGERRGQPFRLHVVRGDEAALPAALFERKVAVTRAHGVVQESQADIIPLEDLSTEWEWEEAPELTLKLVEGVAEAVELFNRYSPRLLATLLSADQAEQAWFFASVDAPFVGDGFTRWVDGQYALGRPELGLSNWQNGRLLARGGILTGDGIYTIRTRATRK
jgi:glutamate-5-semialdehyde dehydrogenase